MPLTRKESILPLLTSFKYFFFIVVFGTVF